MGFWSFMEWWIDGWMDHTPLDGYDDQTNCGAKTSLMVTISIVFDVIPPPNSFRVPVSYLQPGYIYLQLALAA